MEHDNHIPVSDFLADLKEVLSWSVSSDYVERIITDFDFFKFVYDDVELTSGWYDEGKYNEDDIRLAIGRFLCDRLGLEY